MNADFSLQQFIHSKLSKIFNFNGNIKRMDPCRILFFYFLYLKSRFAACKGQNRQKLLLFDRITGISRFRQLEEEKRAINRVDMRFVALYSTLEMLYGNPSLKYFFEFFIQFFRLIIFPVKSKFKGCIQCGADLGTGIG